MSAKNDNQHLSRSNRISRLKATSSDFAAQVPTTIATGHFAKSETRRRYEATYRDLRRIGGWPDEERMFTYYDEVQDCALESYDNRHDEFFGWRNIAHWRKFQGLWRHSSSPGVKRDGGQGHD